MQAERPIVSARGEFDFAIGDELRGERATLGRSLLDVQRDLRIKAAYVAAIENADPSVIPNPSFLPGYVRAYARYLGRDPDEVFARFCAETGFVSPAAGGLARSAAKRGAAPPVPKRRSGAGRPDFPMAFPLAEPRRRGLDALPFSALGSLLVLLGLVGALGYGGWTVLHNIQRVQFAPVEEAPVALATVDQPTEPEAPGVLTPALGELARPVAATALADLYRRQEIEVPILAPRDGPIAAIDPDRAGLLAGHRNAARVAGRRDAGDASAAATGPGPLRVASGPDGAMGPDGATAGVDATIGPPAPDLLVPPATGQPAHEQLTIVAERAAWIRVYLSDKTVIFERILETGETYSPPADLISPLIWAGNSGSVYVRLGETLRGPLGSGTRAVRDIVLEPAAITERYGEVQEVPEVISRALNRPIEQAAVTLP